MQKVPNSIRTAFEEQQEQNLPLKERVDSVLRPAANEKGWHYISRLKSKETFAQKLETGRISEPMNLDDFFACTIVVENLTAITHAVALVLTHCTEQYRKPKAAGHTPNSPEAFGFDDLRLYVKFNQPIGMPESEIYSITFEIQFKTFLQHAWSIATHDLTYKTDRISWAKARIAYQIKAVLEHAEISIRHAETLAESPELAKQDKSTKDLIEVLKFVQTTWSQDFLPADQKRLAETVHELLWATRFSLGDLKGAIAAETAQNRGTQTLNLSPYGIVVQSLLNQKTAEMNDYLRKPNARFKVLIPAEIAVPPAIDLTTATNCILIGDRL